MSEFNLEKHNKALKRAMEGFYKAYYDETQKEIDRLKKENARLKEVLEFYADEKIYWSSDGITESEGDADGGKKARAILKEVGDE